MMRKEMDGQVSLFDLALPYGKTSPEHSAPTKEKISAPCWKNWPVSANQTLLFLDLTAGGRWTKAGLVAGDGWSIAWRQMDAQYWGVPQRRKRIALVVDFGGQRAGEILFERKGLSGHPEPRIPPWPGIACYPENGAAGNDCVAGFHLTQEPIVNAEISPCLSQGSAGGEATVGVLEPAYCLQGNTVDRVSGQNGSGIKEDSSFAINATDLHVVAYAAGFNRGQGVSAGGIGWQMECAPGLKAAPSGSNSVPDVLIGAFGANCRNGGLWPELNGTLQAKKDGGWSQNANNVVVYPEKARTLTARHDGSPCADRGGNVIAYGIGNGQSNQEFLPEQCGALNCMHDAKAVLTYDARGNGDGKTVNTITGDHENRVTDYTARIMEKAVRWIVRRLTPAECARLQGYPGNWCQIPETTEKRAQVAG